MGINGVSFFKEDSRKFILELEKEMAQAATQNKKGKKGSIQLSFTELDDLFLNTKGKQMRNTKKKMEKYNDFEK